MSDVLFYHLERRTLEETLPPLVARTLARGWRAFVRTESPARAETLDRLLWTYDEQSFLPHGLANEPDPDGQPVLIGGDETPVNRPDVLFLVGGAVPEDWMGMDVLALNRIVLIFDGRDPAALQIARQAWKGAKAAGHAVTYWKETDAGKWEKQG